MKNEPSTKEAESLAEAARRWESLETGARQPLSHEQFWEQAEADADAAVTVPREAA